MAFAKRASMNQHRSGSLQLEDSPRSGSGPLRMWFTSTGARINLKPVANRA